MYRGFNLKIQEEEIEEKHLLLGHEIFKLAKKHATESLDSFFLENGSINGDKIIENWFPPFPCHIFLSHSHNDFKTAIRLAGLLYDKFKIITFIDSVVWSYCNDLLKLIDDKYSLNPDKQHYNYYKRNYSTAHVHLMLQISLSKMIDSTECIFFLNSPNSISTENELTQKTNSPWIFSEIATTKIVRKQTPIRTRQRTTLFSAKDLNESARAQLNIEYDLELSHLTKLDRTDFFKWINTPSNSAEDALDNLYQQHQINAKFLK